MVTYFFSTPFLNRRAGPTTWNINVQKVLKFMERSDVYDNDSKQDKHTPSDEIPSRSSPQREKSEKKNAERCRL